MKNLTLFLLLISPIMLMSQTRVVNISDLPPGYQPFAKPDADGKVLIQGNPADLTSLADSVFPMVGWPLTAVTGTQKLGGIYANIYDDERLEILFTIGQQVSAWTLDGSAVPGWPKTLALYPDGPPAYGDIDGDGQGEIVVSTRSSGTANQGKIYAFKHDGTSVTGFPVTLGGGPTNTPCLADVDHDGNMEILVTERNYPNGFVGIYKGNGTALPGWPQQMDGIPGSAVAAGDVDNDNIVEIFAESYYKVWGWKADGSVLPGWPYNPGTGRVFSYSTPVLADINTDEFREIIVGDHNLTLGNGQVHVIKPDGSDLAGWPQTLSYWIYCPASIGDVDNDGHYDVVIGDQVLSASPTNELAAWSMTGSFLPGFPVINVNAMNAQILIADFDDDEQVELMADDNTASGIYPAYNHDGTLLTGQGWPLQVTGSSFYINPFVTDLDLDGYLDIGTAGYTSSSDQTSVHLFETTGLYNPGLAFTTVLGFNVNHDGVFTPPETVGITDPHLSGLASPHFNIHPNPSGHSLSVDLDLPVATSCLFILFNAKGEQLSVAGFPSLAGGSHHLTLPADLVCGIYLIQLLTGKNQSQTKKFFQSN